VPAAAEAGQGAPILTHASRSASSCLASFLPLGIFSGPDWRTAVMRRLLSGSPGWIAGPESPPFFIAAKESTLRPAICTSFPWQE
jgi:hypothetical protein